MLIIIYIHRERIFYVIFSFNCLSFRSPHFCPFRCHYASYDLKMCDNFYVIICIPKHLESFGITRLKPNRLIITT